MRVKNCDVYSFMEGIGDKKIIAFGQGLQLSSMINMYNHPRGWENVIKYVVDNNRILWGEDYQVKEVSFKVYSPEKLKEESSKESVVVIFSQRCYEIVSQLNEVHELDDMECYIFPLMQTYTNIEDEPFKKSMDVPVIPKKIHYCWFGRKPLTESAKKCIESWKKYCPDYEIICWNEDNYDVNKHLYTKEAYKHKAYAFVSDYARLEIIYNHGGIYMDTDVEVKRSLDPLLYNKAYCAFSNHVPRINTGLGFGAEKGFPIIKDMIDAYRFEKYEMDDGVNKTLCQAYNTKVLAYHGLIQNGRYQVVKGMACYPKDYFDPMSSYFYLAPKEEKAFSIHQSANTWSENNLVFKKVKDKSKKDIYSILEMLEGE